MWSPGGLGSIIMNKASGGAGITVELFQILKDDAVKGLHSICQQIWKTQQWPQGGERSVFIPIPKKGNAKECSNYRTIALISYASKVMLKILQFRLQQYMNWEIPDVQAEFRKGRGTRDQIANIHGIIEKASENEFSQSCPTLWDPMDYTVYGILQARILEWVAFPFSRGSFQPASQADSLPAELSGKPWMN